MAKVIVTGGAGFIGSHLVEALIISKGHNVIVVDNLSPQRIVNLKPVWNSQKLSCFESIDDIIEQQNLEDLDYIFHLGGKSDFLSLNFRDEQ